MTDKPSCETCPIFTKGTERGESGMGFCQIDHRSISWQQWCILKEKGCLSHPQAREYLMEPVINELGVEIQSIEDEIPEMQNLGNINKAMQTVDVLRASITLIKEGVKK